MIVERRYHIGRKKEPIRKETEQRKRERENTKLMMMVIDYNFSYYDTIW